MAEAPLSPLPPQTPPTEPTPTTPPLSPDTQTPAPDLAARAVPRMSTLRTFKQDLESAVKGENVSLATVAIREAERRRTLGIPSSGGGGLSGRKMLIASLSLVAVGLAVFGTGFLYLQQTPSTSVEITTRVPLIFAELESKMDTTEARTSDVIEFAQRKLRTLDRKIGTVEEVIFTAQKPKLAESGTVLVEEPLTAPELVRGLGTAAPDGFIRNLAAAHMYGIHAWQTNHGFFIFKVSSYERAFEELLSWEGRFMARDLLPLLEERTTREAISEKPFRDAIIRNIDTRVLRDDKNAPILIYGFLNSDTLVIAGSQETFIEILSRFTTPRPVVR